MISIVVALVYRLLQQLIIQYDIGFSIIQYIFYCVGLNTSFIISNLLKVMFLASDDFPNYTLFQSVRFEHWSSSAILNSYFICSPYGRSIHYLQNKIIENQFLQLLIFFYTRTYTYFYNVSDKFICQ